MPYIDDGCEITKCDRCFIEEKTNVKTLDIMHYWDYVIFEKRRKPDIGVFCYECTKLITPKIYALRDVDELFYYVNKLERVINEKRRNGIKNNRTATLIAR